MAGKVFDAIFSNSIGQSRSVIDVDTSDPSRFDAAAKAMEKAIAEARAAALAADRRLAEDDRRTGTPDASPANELDRRSGLERRSGEDRRASTDDRRKGLPDTRPPGSPERRSGIDRRAAAAHGFGKRGDTG